MSKNVLLNVKYTNDYFYSFWSKKFTNDFEFEINIFFLEEKMKKNVR